MLAKPARAQEDVPEPRSFPPLKCTGSLAGSRPNGPLPTGTAGAGASHYDLDPDGARPRRRLGGYGEWPSTGCARMEAPALAPPDAPRVSCQLAARKQPARRLQLA